MNRRLSKDKIESFRGDVTPLRLLGGTPYSDEAISWRVEGDAVKLRLFTDGDEPFTDGVLVTLLKPGKANIVCRFGSAEYVCKVTVRERMTARSGRGLNYYVGDMHDHTSNDHNRVRFCNRGEDSVPARYLEQVAEEGLLDFTVVSDHADIINGREFFRGFADDEDTDHKGLVVFAGSEAEVSPIEEDRYGVAHKNAGEIVTLNSTAFPSVETWDEFFDEIGDDGCAFCTFAHPQIVGFSAAGVWNFSFDKNNLRRFRELFRLIETGDGSNRASNIINEYSYSVALDNGFRVSPTCSSDSHGPVWGYYRFPGKTVIMAPEKTKEAFYDAILGNRVYASSSGNVKLYWEVNGAAAPAVLTPADKYRFRVEIGYFEKRKADEIVLCRVISDKGRCVFETECSGDLLEFEIEDGTASYFYLRLCDRFGRKTWSCPIWTGRTPAADKTPLVPVSKEGFTAVDTESGKDAGVLFNDDPQTFFRSEKTVCTIVADMHRTEKISAFSHYPRILSRAEIRREGLSPTERIAFFPSAFRLWTSVDGEEYTLQYDGVFRVFGGEEFFRFPETEARYVKLEVLCSCGKASSNDERFAFSLIDMAELTFWKKA